MDIFVVNIFGGLLNLSLLINQDKKGWGGNTIHDQIYLLKWKA